VAAAATDGAAISVHARDARVRVCFRCMDGMATRYAWSSRAECGEIA
jgi:hypothetical protein